MLGPGFTRAHANDRTKGPRAQVVTIMGLPVPAAVVAFASGRVEVDIASQAVATRDMASSLG